MTNHSSPTCVTEFTDGQTTRMTTWSANGKPDLRRGIKLAHAAYESRKKCEPPAITALHFETADGASVTTTQFMAEEIAKAIDEFVEATDALPRGPARAKGPHSRRGGDR